MAQGALARVIPLFHRACWDCVHREDQEDEHGVSSWCSLVDQPIDDEHGDAEDCDTYERN